MDVFTVCWNTAIRLTNAQSKSEAQSAACEFIWTMKRGGAKGIDPVALYEYCAPLLPLLN